MKNYPRIYSLSTLGLIHHYENDYLFHNMRTDFVGDSGSGKSIIADLLQLILPAPKCLNQLPGRWTKKGNWTDWCCVLPIRESTSAILS